MALSWWPVALIGFVCLAGAFALALFVPTEQVRRQLRPLANTSRLTGLPEYARVARARALSMIVTIVLLLLLSVAAVLTSARPTGVWWSQEAHETPEDIMLCVGQPAADPATGAFLAYFAQQARTYGAQRIGLTSSNRRVVPLTRDHQFAIERFSDATRLVAPVTYVDYAPSVADVLALCMTGFPASDEPSDRRRSLIYLGPGELRGADETRPSLYTDQDVTDMARTEGIQVNVLASSPGPLRALADATGGRYTVINGDDADLAAELGAIRAHPPEVARTATVTGWRGDDPTIPLAVATVVAALLCLALAVLRR